MWSENAVESEDAKLDLIEWLVVVTIWLVLLFHPHNVEWLPCNIPWILVLYLHLVDWILVLIRRLLVLYLLHLDEWIVLM